MSFNISSSPELVQLSIDCFMGRLSEEELQQKTRLIKQQQQQAVIRTLGQHKQNSISHLIK